MSTRKHKVFVYGTLREDKKATHTLPGYTMFLVRGTFEFPGLRPGPAESVVHGNLLTVDDTQLEDLDQYEGVHGGLYTRNVVDVVDAKGKTTKAFVYILGENVIPSIPSGDWFAR